MNEAEGGKINQQNEELWKEWEKIRDEWSRIHSHSPLDCKNVEFTGKVLENARNQRKK